MLEPVQLPFNFGGWAKRSTCAASVRIQRQHSASAFSVRSSSHCRRHINTQIKAAPHDTFRGHMVGAGCSIDRMHSAMLSTFALTRAFGVGVCSSACFLCGLVDAAPGAALSRGARLHLRRLDEP